jgi:hypothetical protein
MSIVNRPNRLTLDAYSDPLLTTKGPNGVYSSFTNVLKNPILGAKGVQLVNANFINSALQLNDQSQLFFFYYASATQAGIATLANLKCIRLVPSSYVPASGFTAFTPNEYFNTVSELVTQLNLAASAGGDSATYNPLWTAGQVTFSYDTTTRRISVAGNGTTYIAPAAADDPNVIDTLLGTTTASNRIKMATFGSTNYATATFQPYVLNESMNARLGFAMGYGTRGLYWGGSSQVGCATAIGVPSNSSSVPVSADTWPILLGSQNVGVYLDISTGGGMDSLGNKNLIASIPIENPPLAINSYTTNSVEIPSLSTPNEIYQVTVTLIDDAGLPFIQPPNFNTQIALAIYY